MENRPIPTSGKNSGGSPRLSPANLVDVLRGRIRPSRFRPWESERIRARIVLNLDRNENSGRFTFY
ncbi:hypothetical protein B4135_2168 [Caldibacillus debilis]|uniref:Uncharacterized protein n=1 Tax=Caldibacillus debilis TaxID=301148 RepID=A0A150M3R5_9BACI|nr:hypothetical protein B4135_2168 [Caldibacillus debilis]